MRIPSAIDSNTLKAYEIDPKSIAHENRTLESFNLNVWDQQLPKSLQELCIEVIAKNWTENPILDEIVLPIDRYFLLDCLETDLPLTLTVPKIPDDIYWKRCYLEKWPTQVPKKVKPIEISEIFRGINSRKLSSIYSEIGENNHNGSRSSQTSLKSKKSLRSTASDPDKESVIRSWKEYYIEMYLKEYLENLKPEDYDATKIKELSDLCHSYVKVLKIDQMQCSENSSNRIPLNSLLNGFQNLTELSICFKQTYVGTQFSWNVLNTAFQDIKLLAKGLEKLRLKVLRIRNSAINCEKIIIILKILLKHEINTLDFSHCKIADKGTLAISKFILEVPVKELILSNNRIGPKGIEYLSYALGQEKCSIKKLDLHLNNLMDEAGNLLLYSISQMNIMESLFLAGCGFQETFAVGRLVQTNNSLEFLDVSNNNLGENGGRSILQAMISNSTLKKINLRMCGIPTDVEFEIQKLVTTKRQKEDETIQVEPVQDGLYMDISNNNDKLIAEFETILQ